MSDIDRIALNDDLTAFLSQRGWHAQTETDYDRLNNLVHEVADSIDRFLNLDPKQPLAFSTSRSSVEET